MLQIQCAVMDLVYRLATGGYTRGVPQPNLYLQKVVPRKGSMPVGLTGYQLNVLRQREMETGEALRCDQMTAVIDQALELGRLPHRPLPHETSIDGSRTIVQTMIAAYWAETVTYKGETMKRSKMHNLKAIVTKRTTCKFRSTQCGPSGSLTTSAFALYSIPRREEYITGGGREGIGRFREDRRGRGAQGTDGKRGNRIINVAATLTYTPLRQVAKVRNMAMVKTKMKRKANDLDVYAARENERLRSLRKVRITTIRPMVLLR